MAVGLSSYDTTKVQSLSLDESQLGADIVNLWDETLPKAFSSSATYGVTFDFSINNDSEQGLALAPSRPFTSATSDLAGTGETAETWALTITTNITSAAAIVTHVGTLTLYAVYIPAPSSFSNSNLASTNLVTSGRVVRLDTILATDSEWATRGGAGIYSLLIPLSFAATGTDQVAGTTVLQALNRVVNSGSWNGLVQFIWTSTAVGGASAATGATFAGKTHKWHTGQTDVDITRRARVVHDYITSQTYLSDEAVPDGYRDGIMVHPDNYDPPDPLEESPWTPPPNEGQIDDEITDPEN